jgi:succinyl-diaminopimelate desuccinylase
VCPRHQAPARGGAARQEQAERHPSRPRGLDLTDLLRLTAELVDIPSESHHEAAVVGHLAGILRADAPWLVVDRVGDNLVARTTLGRARRLVLAGHTDTVPEAGNLPARLDGDTLWGLGAADMKAGLAVMVALATTVSDPAVDVSYVFYVAEEVAAADNGLGHLFADRPDLVAGDVAILGEPTGGVIEAGCQGTMRVRLTVAGERAHTARPWMGRNAIQRLAPVLDRLAGYAERRPVLDGCEFREALQAVRIEGGVAGPDGSWRPAGNVVPDRAVLTVNHRFAPDRTPEEALAHVRAVLEPEGGLASSDEVELVDLAPGASPGLDDPLLAALVVRHHLEVRAKLGWTDVARFATAGIPAVNFGPGDATLAHTPGERVERAALERVYAVLDDLLRRGA